MHERVFLQDVKDGKGGVRFAKGKVYGPYPFSTWNDIAGAAKKPLEKMARRIEEQATASVKAGYGTGTGTKKRRAA